MWCDRQWQYQTNSGVWHTIAVSSGFQDEFWFVGAACGTRNDTISIRDLGNGLCISTTNISRIITQGTCSAPVFEEDCLSFKGSLVITIANDGKTDNTPYIPPNINASLTAMGLGNINTVGMTLRVVVDNFPFDIPQKSLAPVFLTSLKQAGFLEIRECINCAANPDFGPLRGSVLAALPGLSNLYQLTGISTIPSSSSLTVYNTAFTDLTSFSGLRCPAAVTALVNNAKLATFSGLEYLATPTSAANLIATGSGPFTTAASLAAIRVFAGCIGNTSSQIGTVAIPVSVCGKVLKSYAAICAFNGSAPCPPR